MKFFIVNDELKRQLKGIQQKIVLSMNGVTVENMKKYGIIYKKNYGVSITRLREIASFYSQNHDLAQRLWAMGIRETMILATLLQPVDKLDKKNIVEWVEKIDNIELAEQLCMNLLCKSPLSVEWALSYMQSDNVWDMIIGFLLGIRICGQFPESKVETVIDIAIEKAHTDIFLLYKNIAIFLARLSRTNIKTSDIILERIKSVESVNNPGLQYVSNEVKEEILFLKNLKN